MKKLLIFQLCILLLPAVLQGQSVVNMVFPEQSGAPLEVVALFDEALPEGMPVVLGVFGFGITGGKEPLTFRWLKDGVEIGSDNTIVIKAEKGSSYALEVADQCKCRAVHTIAIEAAAQKSGENYLMKTVEIFPTLVKDRLNIRFKAFVPENTSLKIYDMQGKLQVLQPLYYDESIALTLSAGDYLVVVDNGELYQVKKISVKP